MSKGREKIIYFSTFVYDSSWSVIQKKSNKHYYTIKMPYIVHSKKLLNNSALSSHKEQGFCVAKMRNTSHFVIP
jgi:hypothetical protein